MFESAVSIFFFFARPFFFFRPESADPSSVEAWNGKKHESDVFPPKPFKGLQSVYDSNLQRFYVREDESRFFDRLRVLRRVYGTSLDLLGSLGESSVPAWVEEKRFHMKYVFST
jgi:hypothetical protein